MEKITDFLERIIDAYWMWYRNSDAAWQERQQQRQQQQLEAQRAQILQNYNIAYYEIFLPVVFDFASRYYNILEIHCPAEFFEIVPQNPVTYYPDKGAAVLRFSFYDTGTGTTNYRRIIQDEFSKFANNYQLVIQDFQMRRARGSKQVVLELTVI